MEYNRLVAYIYSYNSGLKNRNVGFARMEVRNDNIKMTLNMKNAVVEGYSIWGVYLFCREGEDICGIKLGEMTLGSGTDDFTYSGTALNIENSEKNFEDIRGMFLISGNNKSYVFASEWDDNGFAPERIITEWKKSEPIELHVENPEPEYRVAEQPYEPEPNDYADNGNEYPDDNMEFKEEMEIMPPSYMEDTTDFMINPDFEKRSDEKTESSEIMRMWDLISEGREKKFIFADDELYDVIEITPDDIDKMPNTNWHLKNNSFVNHGYFNFRHLIAGRMNSDDGTGFFIGVPGIYNRRERNLASMYGFNRFKFSMRSDMRLNQFGYWYREITD